MAKSTKAMPLDFQTTLVNSQDPDKILELWTKWMDISSPFRDEFVSILESVNDVASVNNATDADSYWLMQTEFPGSYDDARKLWEGIKPLYLKLQSYVRSRLASRYGEQALDNSTDIPAHLLGWFTFPRSFDTIKARAVPKDLEGSLLSYDWSNIADVVFSDTDVVHANIQKALKEKNLGGKSTYETAGKLLTKLGLDEGGPRKSSPPPTSIKLLTLNRRRSIPFHSYCDMKNEQDVYLYLRGDRTCTYICVEGEWKTQYTRPKSEPQSPRHQQSSLLQE
uniref:Uncharacterized protein n=1 Tax=Timema monikensis TaxID=170555 RepID=A0A7R9DY61_9NEOP|nr:unnamed protein product [Timema monikensis]